MKAVVIGHVCGDINTCSNAQYSCWGSPAMFIAKIFGFLDDVSTLVVSHHGQDFREHTEGIEFYPKMPTTDTTLTYKNYIFQDARKLSCTHFEEAIPVQIDEALKKRLAEADLLVVAPILPNFIVPYINEVLGAVKPSALKILIPKGYFRRISSNNEIILREFEEVFEIGPKFDFVIIPKREHPALESRLRLWPPQMMVLLTDGLNGVSIIQRGKGREVPGRCVPKEHVIDPIGCSDIFAAGFAYSYFKTRDLQYSVSIGQQLSIWRTRYTTVELSQLGEVPEYLKLHIDHKRLCVNTAAS